MRDATNEVLYSTSTNYKSMFDFHELQITFVASHRHFSHGSGIRRFTVLVRKPGLNPFLNQDYAPFVYY